jgi:hypothetical protein
MEALPSVSQRTGPPLATATAYAYASASASATALPCLLIPQPIAHLSLARTGQATEGIARIAPERVPLAEIRVHPQIAHCVADAATHL